MSLDHRVLTIEVLSSIVLAVICVETADEILYRGLTCNFICEMILLTSLRFWLIKMGLHGFAAAPGTCGSSSGSYGLYFAFSTCWLCSPGI